MSARLWTVLKVAAAVETVSLLVLVINLVADGSEAVAGAVGPLHGTCYLATILATFLLPRADRTARALSVIPAIGSLLAVRRIATHPA